MTRSENNLLLVCDAFLDGGSGATAARLAADAWTTLGYRVTAFAPIGRGTPLAGLGNKYDFVAKPPFRSKQHFWRSEALIEFDRLLRDRRPEVVFFLGTVYSNPVSMLRSAVQSGARTIFMTWNQSFYCARSYAFLDGAPCSRCVSGNQLPALRHGCDKPLPWLAGSAARLEIRKCLARFDALICSSEDQTRRLVAFGIEPQKIHQCPLFFDTSRLEDVSTHDGDYFIYCAQPTEAKGWHFIPAIIESAPSARFVLCPTLDSQTAIANAPGLENLIDEQRVFLHTGIGWRNGLSDLIGRARGVIIPSIWPTTTEYVLLEALGLAKPIVAFDVGIHPEILRNGVNAMIAHVPDTKEFAQAINVVNGDASLRYAIGIEAKKLYDQLTDENVILNALRKAIQ